MSSESENSDISDDECAPPMTRTCLAAPPPPVTEEVSRPKQKKKKVAARAPSDSDSDDNAVIHPEQLSPRKELALPVEPVDAAKAATDARKSAQTDTAKASEFDDSLLPMQLVIRGDKNESAALAKMSDCSSGTLASEYPELAYGDSKLKKDAHAKRISELIVQHGGKSVASMLLFFSLEDDRTMAVLPVTLTNPDGKPEVGKCLKKIDESVKGKWFYGLPVPEESVKYLYSLRLGMPSTFDPNLGSKFGKINNIQEFSLKKGWALIFDASRGAKTEKGEKRKLSPQTVVEKKSKPEEDGEDATEYRSSAWFCSDALVFTLPQLPPGFAFCSFVPPTPSAVGVGILRREQ